MSTIIRMGPCPSCGSSDAQATYADGSRYCFSGNHKGRKDTQPNNTEQNYMIDFTTVASLPIKALDVRGVDAAQAAEFGVRTEIDTETGEDNAYYFPLYDRNLTLVGYQRKAARPSGARQKGDVTRVGETKATLPFGAHRAKPGQGVGFVIVTEGGEDCLAAKQMLAQLGKNYRCVSTLGTNVWKNNLEYFETFAKVVIAFDQDDAGLEAAGMFAQALSAGKGHIMRWNGAKDPNELLARGDADRFYQSISQAKPFQPEGLIYGFERAWEIISDYTAPECIPYPDDWPLLQQKMGGLRRGEISLWTGGSSVGKSAFVRRLKQHVIQNTNWKLADIELEESKEKTIRAMLQFQAGKLLTDMTLEEKRAATLATYGTGRLITLEHRSQYTKGQSLLGKLKHLRYAMGCDIIILDHLSLAQGDFGDGVEGLAQQDRMMSDLLGLVESTGVHMCVISHLRKAPAGTKGFEEGAMPTMDALKGSGSVKQISFDIIALARNNQHPDEYERNTTQMSVLKCRETGNTGHADRIHWDRMTQSLVPAKAQEADDEI